MNQKLVKPPYLVGPLAWLVPGAGHWYLGLRARGVILFLTITALFWMGVAIGGLRSTVDPQRNLHWFMGEACTGGNALLAVGINNSMNWSEESTENRSWGKARDIGVVYAGVAGLLNLLAIFDAIVRSMTGQVAEEEEPAEAEPESGSEEK
jgi:hypothetical protein